MFWRHFFSLWKKNLILYKRNWKGSLCEVLCPIILVALVLLMRVLMSKSEKSSDHQFNMGHIWYDRRGTTTNDAAKEFLGYTMFNSNTTDWMKYCLDRGYGPDRSIVALAPSSSTIVQNVKASLDADLAAYNLTTQLYGSRADIFDVLNSGSYEKDNNPGI